MQEPPIVISVGGSLIVPNGGINTDFLIKLNKLIREEVSKGRRFLLIAGGGKLCRHYQDAGIAVIGNLTQEDLDWLGVHATHLNGQLLRTIFQDIANPRVIQHYDRKLENWTEPIAIGAGWKPGWTTDYDSVILARDHKAKIIINMSNIDYVYDKDPAKFNDAKPIEEKFFSVLNSLEFIPGGRILAEAGTESSQLFSCFVLPLEDSMKNIFKTLYEKALIQRVGGGIGFSFSKIRPRGILSTMKGYAHGPLDFLELFDHATELTKLPGNRKSANMGSLSVHHPDIIHFITAKEGENKLTNFNLSVEITDAFMKALEKDEQYDLMSPATGKVVGRNSARQTFNLLATMAWKNGEPGILFIDTINKDNPLKKIGRIETTDPCGDQPLFPYEGVPLGALNLSKFVKDKEVDYDRLEEAVPIAVRFLDNAVDACKLPLNAVTTRTKELRRIGIGILGFADMLYQMRIPYNSQLALETGRKVMQTIRKQARMASEELAEEKGPFPLWETSGYRSKKIRNATITTISPTGSRSLLAGTSCGIEPVYALAYKRKLMGSQETVIVNNFFLQALREKDLYSEELISQIAQTGNINDAKSPTIEMKKVFVTALEIPPEWHIKMQAAFQEYVDNAISKTINIPNSASIEDIENAFLLAYKSGCKGITVYRDGSRSDQVYTSGAP